MKHLKLGCLLRFCLSGSEDCPRDVICEGRNHSKTKISLDLAQEWFSVVLMALCLPWVRSTLFAKIFERFFFSDVYCANPNEEDNEEDLLITFMIDD